MPSNHVWTLLAWGGCFLLGAATAPLPTPAPAGASGVLTSPEVLPLVSPGHHARRRSVLGSCVTVLQGWQRLEDELKRACDTTVISMGGTLEQPWPDEATHLAAQAAADALVAQVLAECSADGIAPIIIDCSEDPCIYAFSGMAADERCPALAGPHHQQRGRARHGDDGFTIVTWLSDQERLTQIPVKDRLDHRMRLHMTTLLGL